MLGGIKPFYGEHDMRSGILYAAALLLGLNIHSAWASSDIDCWPSWTLQQDEYDRCNNVPMLAPSNNSRLNLQFLMADKKMAALEVALPDKEYASVGYGKVPFYLLNSMESIVTLSQPGAAKHPDGG